jgi:hypothetical protein
MPSRLALLLAICLFALAASPAPGARAQSEDAKQQASAFYTEGERLFAAGVYAAAIENFERAQEILPHPVNLYNIARSYEKLGDGARCVRFYDQYVGLYREREGRDPSDIVEVRVSISKCRLLLKSDVAIGSEPAGANVYIDDRAKLLGQTPYTTSLDPGTYRIHLSLDGYMPFEETFEVRAGEPLRLFFKLEKLQRVGRLRVKANVRDASIFVDGRPVGLTPYREPLTLDVGPHQVSVRKDGYTTFSAEAAVALNAETEVRSGLYLADAPMTWKGYLGWTAMSLGAVLVGGGVAAGVQADTFFAGSPDFDTWAGYQKIGFGAGGGLLGLGLLFAILDSVDDAVIRSGDALEPWAGTGRTGGLPTVRF